MESVEIIRWEFCTGLMMTDCTAVGDEVVIMMMLSMMMMCISLSFYDWLIVVPTCSLYGGWVGLGLGRWYGPTDNSALDSCWSEADKHATCVWHYVDSAVRWITDWPSTGPEWAANPCQSDHSVGSRKVSADVWTTTPVCRAFSLSVSLSSLVSDQW